MRNLKAGHCYFTFSYYDEDVKMPLIETFVFLGLDLMEDDPQRAQRTWYFKRPDSFMATAYRFEKADYENCIRMGEDTIDLMLDFGALVEQLQVWAAAHQ